MMRKALLVLGVALSGCSYNNVDPGKPEEPIFTLLTDPNTGKGSVNWLMIHSADGHLLSSQKFTSGDGVVATSNATKDGDFINVTFMQYSIHQGYGGYTYNLSTYLNIPLHDTWTIQPSLSPNSGSYLGSFKVTVAGFPTASRVNISDVYGGSALLFFDGSFNSVSTELGVYPATRNFLFSCRDPQSKLNYKFLDSIRTDQSYTVGPADLQPAESSIQVPLSQMDSYSLNVSGVRSSESIGTGGYIIHNDYVESTLPTTVSIWFPAVFSSFRTSLGLINTNGTYYFQSVGTKPTDIAITTDKIFKITNRSIQNFQYLGNADFQQRTSVWEYHNGVLNPEVAADIVWTVYSPPGVAQKILELPSNFSAIYSDLKLDHLVHTSTTFGLQGAISFDDLVNSTFKGQQLPANQEYYSVKLK